MREILFKAKWIDNGEWIIGSLIKTKNDYYICEKPYECMGEYSSLNGRSYGFGGFKFVDQSTICQYTGLNDKNGQKIWENDVVEIPQENGKFIIEWNETEAKWQMNNYAEEFIVDFDNYWSYNTEVIGNIFDNTELLNE